ncbi:thioredoxin [Ahniella affigens]|uniref:Thioredoxin n=1 Tax=Ahniella affigens TaxID=2021234 RepID=A0A2P1PPI5_9GAMM|nr:thioredoxin [Ahniella affigens]AVP96745.1 thioredoxin [Ahniella affigens]
MSEALHSFDVTVAEFQDKVLKRSLETPVLVDFWATWCGPCKTLKPILEKLAADYNGAFELAKVDVDKEQQLAAYFGIRSVPTVMLVKDGQLVDGFPGALPEGQLREFLSSHQIVPLEAAEPEVVEVELDPHSLVATLRAQIAAEPDNADLKLELIGALLKIGESDEASRLLDALPPKQSESDLAKRARSQLEFARDLQGAPAPTELRKALASNENDHQSRYLLAVHDLLDNQAEGALEGFLEIMRRDRKFGDDQGRKSLIKAFALIEDADLVSRTRKRMAAMIF